jgi:hypothetical protein
MKAAVLLFCCIVIAPSCFGQSDEYDSLLAQYLKSDSLLLDELELKMASDSLDIFELMDSLLNKDYQFSQFSFRTGYNSEITYAGRNFGISQHGFHGGISYYHKSGLFADLSGYWNSALDPSYNPTIATMGYMGSFNKKWTFTMSFDHFFYNEPSGEDSLTYYPLINSANYSMYYELGKTTIYGDYSFMFGEEKAHRVRFGLMHTFSKSFRKGLIDRVSFVPSASVLLGDATIFLANPVYPEWNRNTRLLIRELMIMDFGYKAVRELWKNDRKKYFELEKKTYTKYQEYFFDYEYSTESKFGIMNYSFAFPLYLYMDRFTVALNYFYNVPVALPGEEIDLENNSYVGISIIYNIPLLKKKN